MSAQCRMRVMAVFLLTLKKAAMSFVVLKKQVLAGIILTEQANTDHRKADSRSRSLQITGRVQNLDIHK